MNQHEIKTKVITFQTIIKKSKLDQNKISIFQTNVKNLNEIK